MKHGISPKLWGRQGWHFIHIVALSYPDIPTEKEKEGYLKFLYSLQDVLPCSSCAEHWRMKLEAFPPKMGSRTELFNWTVDMHNLVNKQNGKKEISYQEALDELKKNGETYDLKVSDLKKGLALSFSLISVLLLLSYVIAKKK
jgi:hypothetical protein